MWRKIYKLCSNWQTKVLIIVRNISCILVSSISFKYSILLPKLHFKVTMFLSLPWTQFIPNIYITIFSSWASSNLPQLLLISLILTLSRKRRIDHSSKDGLWSCSSIRTCFIKTMILIKLKRIQIPSHHPVWNRVNQVWTTAKRRSRSMMWKSIWMKSSILRE